MKKILFLTIYLFTTLYSKGQIPNELYRFLTNVDTTGLYWKADKSPTFPGGMTSLVNFYKENFKYPLPAQKKGIQGTVYVMFIVERNGELSNVISTNSIEKNLDSAAVSFVRKMPRWIPGEKNGKIVRVLNIQPIKFRLE